MSYSSRPARPPSIKWAQHDRLTASFTPAGESDRPSAGTNKCPNTKGTTLEKPQVPPASQEQATSLLIWERPRETKPEDHKVSPGVRWGRC